MSPDGQGAAAAPVPPALVVELGARGGFDTHVHDRHHQLALAAPGVLVMAVAATTWVLPPSRALWIPAGVRHAVSASVATTMLSLYVEPDRCPLDFTGPTVVDARGLLGELVVHLSRQDLPGDQRRRAEAVLWDLMAPLPVTAVSAPMPDDDRGRRVAEGIAADPADTRTLAEWGHDVGASARTLARVFVSDTGMTVGRWRTVARIAASLPMLAAGVPAVTVARRVGYASQSAFVAAFRRELGTTPGAYFGGD
ncbi:MAG TPA: helix-turn-helix transcriptional regulator [Acidimicrobiales bacterium]